jgi:2-keto-3-deoxy-galactonokinase
LLAGGTLGALYGRALGLAGFAVRTVDAGAAVQRGLIFAAGRLWPGRRA